MGHVLAMSLAIGAPLLAFVGGYPLAYALMLASILLIVWWLMSQPRFIELRDPGGLTMLAAPLLIAAAFAVTASKADDLVYSFNFAMLALFPLLRAAFARFAVRDAVTMLARAAVGGTLIAAAVAIYQTSVIGMPRAQGYGSDPIWAAQAAIIVGFLPLAGLTREPGLWRLPYLLTPMLAILVAILCGSRGPFLAAVPLILVALLLSRDRVTIALGLAVTIVIGGIVAWFVAPASIERVLTIAAGFQSASAEPIVDYSLDTRLRIYDAAWQAFTDSPIFGYGWDQKVAATYNYIPGGEAAVIATDSMMIGNRHLHSDILDLGVGAGLFGVVAYILALAAPIIGALRSPHDSQRQGRILGTALLCTGTFACGVSYIMLGYEFPTTLYVVLAAALLGLCRDEPSRPAGARSDQ
jgi:O-antigen ligase